MNSVAVMGAFCVLHLLEERRAVATSIPSSQNETDTHRGWVPRGPRSSLERGQFALLFTLLVLAVAAWALTIYQTQTMDMPMGVVPREASAPPTRRPLLKASGTWAT